MNNVDKLMEEVINVKIRYRDLSFQRWLNYEVFSWQWWFGTATILSLIVWWKLVDRKRILEISVFGLIVNVSATILDVTGSELVLWDYSIRVLPHIPMLFPVDFILLPIIDMLIYQYCRKWKQFLIANTIAAAALAFIVEPFAIMIGQYKLFSWRLVYSFPIYLAIAIFSRLVTQKLASRKTA